MTAVVLGRMAGEVHLFTALGDDELGRRSPAALGELGVTGARRLARPPPAQGAGARGRRRASAPSPWSARAPARPAPTTCPGTCSTRPTRSTSPPATPVPWRTPAAPGCWWPPRARCPRSGAPGVQVDALVGSAGDPGERYARRRPRSRAHLGAAHRGGARAAAGRAPAARPLGRGGAARARPRQLRLRRLVRRRRDRGPRRRAGTSAAADRAGPAPGADCAARARARTASGSPPRPSIGRPVGVPGGDAAGHVVRVEARRVERLGGHGRAAARQAVEDDRPVAVQALGLRR